MYIYSHFSCFRDCIDYCNDKVFFFNYDYDIIIIIIIIQKKEKDKVKGCRGCTP